MYKYPESLLLTVEKLHIYIGNISKESFVSPASEFEILMLRNSDLTVTL